MKKPDQVLLLVRHAAAQARHPMGDESRAITPKGRRRFRRHARGVLAQFGPTAIATSPLVRAVQTAELLARAAGVDDVEVHASLTPGPDAGARVAALARRLGPGWALVGHEPALTTAAARLLGLPSFPLELRKGAAIVLRMRKGQLAFHGVYGPGDEPLRGL